jgi:hypothetical protein
LLESSSNNSKLAEPTEFALGLLNLKHLNRVVFKEYETKKNIVDSQKELIDKGNLYLENLQYQETHLKREIKLCKDASFVHLSQVEKAMGTNLVPTAFSSDLVHQKEMAMEALQNELLERQSLQQKLNEITKKQNDITASLAKKSKLIDDLPGIISAGLEGSVHDLKKRLSDELE